MQVAAITAVIALCTFPLASVALPMPIKLGHLSPHNSSVSASGLVYLLDRETVYIKDFQLTHDCPDAAPGLSLTLRGIPYFHGDDIPISAVGNGVANSLVCHTDQTTCCIGRVSPGGRGQGEWHYPDGTVITNGRTSRSAFYRARGMSQIRLNRRTSNGAVQGTYCCRLANAAGVQQSLCVNLVSDSVQKETTQDFVPAYFCAGYSGSPRPVPLPYSSSSFLEDLSEAHLQLPLPSGHHVTDLLWVGVCKEWSVLASVAALPLASLHLPCAARLLGELPSDQQQGEGLAGRVYLTSRRDLVILGFSYSDSNGNDAVILAGTGAPDPNTDTLLSVLGNHETDSLGDIEDQDTGLKLPEEAIGLPLSHVTVYSRSRNVLLSSVKFSPDLLPPMPPTIPGVRVDKFFRRFHQLAGTVYALSANTLYLQGFNYDGTGPTVSFRAVRGSSYLSDEHEDLADETGSYDNLRAYFSEDLVLQLPPTWTVFNTDYLIVWCEEAGTSFGEAAFPQELKLSEQEDIQPPPPSREEDCPPLEPVGVVVNCERLDSDLTVSWVLNDDANQATIKLCGCDMDGQYMAFGLSGRDNFISMVGSDTVWTWLDETGAHAQELHVTAYAQCSSSAQLSADNNGVCPEQSDNVTAVSAFNENCKTCITYTRPIRSNDVLDKDIGLGDQLIVWSVGPVGSLATSSGAEVPIPFKHYRRSEYNNQIAIDFWRDPVDNCGALSCESHCGSGPSSQPWVRPVLDHTTDISVRIGQSGGRKGYPTFTGVVGWGISLYLNELLIPKTTMYRGYTYTFTVETGDNPGDPARYHPFYITDSQRGGYLALSPEAQKDETIYAGVDSSGKFIGVGRFCYYGPVGPDQADYVNSFSEYFDTLRLECEEGEPGVFRWTPDHRTPDTVYFQCATHQYLGWKIKIRDIPSDERPPSVEVPSYSPMIIGRKFKFDFIVFGEPTDMQYSLESSSESGTHYIPSSCVLSAGLYSCNATLPNLDSTVTIRVTLYQGQAIASQFTRSFPNFADISSCGLFSRGTHGVRHYYSRDAGELVLEDNFYSTGYFEDLICEVNDIQRPCGGGVVAVLASDPNPPLTGWNKISIEIVGCRGDQSLSEVFCFHSDTEEAVAADNGRCPRN